MYEDDSPVAKLCNLILLEGMNRKASEIRVDPEETKLTVRYRIAGAFADAMEPPVKLARAIAFRFKMMADLDTSEQSRSQSGQFTIRINDGEDLHFVLTVSPTPFGERVTVRKVESKQNVWMN